MSTAIPAEGASRHIQSTPTSAYTMNDPGGRQVQTRADLEPEVQPEMQSEAPVEPEVAAAEGAVDPVAEQVAATEATDDVNVEKAAAHKASPEETVRIAELEEQRTTMDTQFAAQKAEIQQSLAQIASQEETGDLSPREASLAREALYDQRATLAEQAAMERSVLMAEIKGLESRQAEKVMNWRKPIAEDPQFVSWAQSPEGQAALDDPRNQAVYGGSPAGPWIESQLTEAKGEIESLRAQLAEREKTVAAATQNSDLNKISGVGVNPSPGQTQATNQPDPKKDLTGYLSRHFSA